MCGSSAQCDYSLRGCKLFVKLLMGLSAMFYIASDDCLSDPTRCAQIDRRHCSRKIIADPSDSNKRAREATCTTCQEVIMFQRLPNKELVSSAA